MVEGVIKVQRRQTGLGNAGYTLLADRVSVYKTPR
jgi:hypothetical protein